MKTKDFPAVVESRKVVENQINRYNDLMNIQDKKTNLYVIDTIVTFRHKYVIEAESLEHAYDEITMKDSGKESDYFEEITQRFLSEQIVDGRKIKRKEFARLVEDLKGNKDEHCSYWLGDKLIRKVDYDRN